MTHPKDPVEEYMSGLADFERAAKDHPVEKHEEAMNDDEHNRRSATIPIVLVCAVVVLAFGVVWIF